MNRCGQDMAVAGIVCHCADQRLESPWQCCSSRSVSAMRTRRERRGNRISLVLAALGYAGAIIQSGFEGLSQFALRSASRRFRYAIKSLR